jgi:hypothetical protein
MNLFCCYVACMLVMISRHYFLMMVYLSELAKLKNNNVQLANHVQLYSVNYSKLINDILFKLKHKYE